MRKNKNLIFILGFITIYFNTTFIAWADGSTCRGFENKNPSIGIMKRVTYVPETSSDDKDLRADSDGKKYFVKLQGWLYYPNQTKVKDFPVLIFNHGHEEERPEPCNVAKYFVEQGFVVFAPLRRGHVAKKPSTVPDGWDGIESTGVFTDRYVDDCVRTGKCACNSCSLGGPLQLCPKNGLEVDYLRQQVSDVRDQIRFIKNYPALNTNGKLADPAQIALLGHSWGGSLVVFANQELNQQNAVIDISGAELSWNDEHPFWETEMTCAMSYQKRPIYFLQPKNGRSVLPTLRLSGLAATQKYASQAKIFPATSVDINSKDPAYLQAHKNFISDRDQIEIWGPSVIEFIKKHPFKPGNSKKQNGK